MQCVWYNDNNNTEKREITCNIKLINLINCIILSSCLFSNTYTYLARTSLQFSFNILSLRISYFISYISRSCCAMNMQSRSPPPSFFLNFWTYIHRKKRRGGKIRQKAQILMTHKSNSVKWGTQKKKTWHA